MLDAGLVEETFVRMNEDKISSQVLRNLSIVFLLLIMEMKCGTAKTKQQILGRGMTKEQRKKSIRMQNPKSD